MEESELRRRGKLTCVRTRVPAFTRTVSPRTPLQRSLARSCALAHNLIPSASGERRRRRRRRRAGSAAPARQHGSQVHALVCCAELYMMWNCCVCARAPCARFPDGGASLACKFPCQCFSSCGTPRLWRAAFLVNYIPIHGKQALNLVVRSVGRRGVSSFPPSLPPFLSLSRALSRARALSAQTRDKEREGDDSDGGARTSCNRAREVQCRTYRVVTGA